jgi:hypothetical protein
VPTLAMLFLISCIHSSSWNFMKNFNTESGQSLSQASSVISSMVEFKVSSN